MPALFVMSLTQAAWHKMAAQRLCLCNFLMSIFNKQDEKSREKLLCVFHFFFVQLRFNVALRPQTLYGLLGMGGAQDVHLDFHTAPELCLFLFLVHSYSL